MRRILAVTAWNVGLLVAGLVAMEMIFGGWLDSFRAPALWRLSIYRDVEWTMPVSGLYDGSAVAIYRRDGFGLRGKYGQPHQVNVLAIGGSTTDERFISEGETWVDALMDCLVAAGQPARIANAGVAGQSSRGHIRAFNQWLAHVPGLRPRYVLVYLGVNEGLLEGRITNDDLNMFNESSNPLWLERLKLNSALYALYKIVAGNVVAYRAGIHHLSTVGSGTGKAAYEIDRAFQAQADLAVVIGSAEYKRRLSVARNARQAEADLYRERLAQLSRVITEFGAEAIFVTQTEAAFRIRDGRIWGDLDRYFALEVINEVTLGHCAAAGALCIDLGRKLRVEDGDFYDVVHTTPQGSRKVGRFICERLASEPHFSLVQG